MDCQELSCAIVKTGSLAGGAKKLDMSYRTVGGCLKASENRLRFALLKYELRT